MANRIGRLELLFWFTASILGGGIVLGVVAALTHTEVADRSPHPWPQALVFIAAAVVILKACLSRLHDLGWSGWVVLLMFVPLIDILALVVLLVAPGQKQANLYGEPPTFLERMRKPT